MTKVMAMDIKTGEISQFNSFKEAAEYVDVNVRMIYRVCAGRIKQSRGHVFVIESENAEKELLKKAEIALGDPDKVPTPKHKDIHGGVSMPISFKSDRRKVLKTMYNDVVDAYIAEVAKNRNLTKEERAEMIEDANVWKLEYKELIEAL